MNKSLKVCTWNLWFELVEQKERIQTAMAEIINSKVDVACLQEVTKSIIEVIQSDPSVEKCYQIFYDKYSIDQYANIFLVKKGIPVSSFESIGFPVTRMGRRVYELSLYNKSIFIFNVHLESEFSGKPDGTKAKQLHILLHHANKVCSSNNNATGIITGDFNLAEQDEKWSKKMIADANVTDITRDIPTYDCKRNTNILWNYVSRLDRIMCTGKKPTSFANYKLLGLLPIKSNPRIFPSDHFGIVVDFQFC